jgi:hypothetical protein
MPRQTLLRPQLQLRNLTSLISIWLQAALSRIVLQQSGKNRKREQDDCASEDRKRSTPAETRDQTLSENRN